MEINIIPKFIDEAASAPAKAVGNTLTDLWSLAIGSHISLWSKKQEIRQQKNLQSYIQKVEDKTQEIPDEYIKEPELHIIGPVIEASKYYIDSEELREMFANLIASSIDIRKSQSTHPAFVEIIKQLSPFDAQNIKVFQNPNDTNGSNGAFPIVNYGINYGSEGHKILHKHVFLPNLECDTDAIASSLINLQRLGLISIDYSKDLYDKKLYKRYEDHKLYTEISESIKTNEHHPDLIEILKNLNISFDDVHPYIQKGSVGVTPLGKDFVDTCL